MGWARHNIVKILTYIILLGAVSILFFYKQNTLIPGADAYEHSVVESVQNYQYPWRAPLNSPYITASYIVAQTSILTSLQSARLISAIASVLSIYMFYQLLRNWLLSPGKAVVGTVVFATSSWLLVLGRGAHSTIVGVFLLLLVFTLGTRLLFTTKPLLDWLTLVVATVLSIYTPMLGWLLFLAGIVSMLHYRQRQRSLPLKKWHKIVIALVAIVLLAPLIASIVRLPSIVFDLLSIRTHISSLSGFILNFNEIVKNIFFFSDNLSVIGLGNLPMLDIFSLFMFLLGCYYFERRLSLKRSKMLFGGLLMGIVICSLVKVDMQQVSILLPLVYIFISAGIHETITRWLAVFPRNPIARAAGIATISIAIGFVSFYHLSRVFIARPGNPAIHELYTLK